MITAAALVAIVGVVIVSALAFERGDIAIGIFSVVVFVFFVKYAL